MNRHFRLTARVFTALFIAQTLLAAAPAYAQIAAQLTAAPAAPIGQKPLIDAAANGTPIVLIAPPSKAGVSHNQFDQFNVSPKGLILNNSTQDVQTQQGGWIKGNLLLGLTPARIILNEVTGPNDSQLRGTIEVGGQRADIVIANPNGITCDGCGFLNANRATLTTGTPQFGADGNIAGFDVRRGALNVGPNGLNATEQQQLDIYARGAVIEGEVWSQNLQALIGANQVVYGTLGAAPQSVPQAGEGAAPRFAIDIKALGGMYANSIFLIATDKGLGVNSTGRTATLAGNFALSADGDLTLKDTYSSQDMRLASTGKTTLTGQTLAEGTARIEAPRQLVNSGALQANKLQLITPAIDNSGSAVQSAPGQNLTLALPGGLSNSGSIYTPGDLIVQATTVGTSAGSLTAGQLQAGRDININAVDLDLRGQQLAANGNIAVQSDTLRVTDGSMNAGGNIALDAISKLDVTGTAVGANGTVRLAGSEVTLDRAHVSALGNVQIASTGAVSANASDISSNTTLSMQASRIDLRSATVTAVVSASIKADGEIKLGGSQLVAGERIVLQGQGIATDGATVAASKIEVDAGSGALSNLGGKIQASSTDSDALTVNATGIGNQGGELRSNGGLTLDAQGGRIDNTDGVIAGTSGTLSRMGGLTNRGGVLYTQSDLAISGTSLDNAQGTIATAGSLSINTPGHDIDNTGGTLQAGTSVTLDAGNAAIANAGGTVSGGAAVSLTASAVNTAGGTIASGQALNITAGTLLADNATLGSNDAMTLTVSGQASLNAATVASGGNLTVRAQELQASGASVASAGDVQVSADTIHGGNWSAQGNLTVTAQGVLDVTGGGLLANGSVTASAQGIVTDNAQVGGQTVTLNAGLGSLSNFGGTISAMGTGGRVLSITANGIDNTAGVIASAADADINARGETVNNTGGTIQVAGELNMQGGQLLNSAGNLASGSDLTLKGFALDNNGGTIQTTGNLTVDTTGKALDNTGGTLAAQGNATINAGTLSNVGGTISSGGATLVHATKLDTTGGSIVGATQLDVVVPLNLVARNATLATNGQLNVSAGNIDAQGATIQAGKGLNVAARDMLDVSGATVAALGSRAGELQLTGTNIAASHAVVAGDAGVTFNASNALEASNARLTARGNLTVQAAAALTLDNATLQTNQQLSVGGGTVAATGASLSAGGKAEVIATAGSATLNGASLSAGDTASVVATGIAAGNARIAAVGDVTLAAGTGDFNAPAALVLSQVGGIAVSGAAVNLAAPQAPVAGAAPASGLLAAQAVTITAGGAVDTSNAVIGAGTSVAIAAQGALTNRGGQIIAATQATLSGTSLINDGGVIDANGAVNISVSQGTVSNDGGRIATRDVLTMAAPSGSLSWLSNQGGTINSTGALSLNQQSFNNAGGNVTALSGLSITGGAVNNTAGTLAAQGSVTVNTAGAAFQGAGGRVLSEQGSVTLATGAATLTDAVVLADGDLTLTATQAAASGATLGANTGALRVDASGGAANFDGASLTAASAISVSAGATTLARATVAGGAAITLTTDSLDASSAHIDAQTAFSATAGTGAIAASQARIAATTAASLNAAQSVAIDQGSISAQTIAINAGTGALNNTGGSIIASADTGTALTLQSRGLANDGGQILSNSALGLDAGAGTLTNTGGTIAAVTTANIGATGLDNRAGVIAANGNLIVNAAQAGTAAATDNSAGSIRSAHGLVTLTTGELRNAGSAGGDTGVAGAGAINAATDLTITAAGAIDNTGAQIAAGGNLNVSSGGNVANAGGMLQAVGALTLNSNGLDNQRGVVLANAAVNVNAAVNANPANAVTATLNSGGTIASREAGVTLTTGELRNAGSSGAGVITSAIDTTVSAAGAIDNTGAQISAGRNLDLASTGRVTNTDGLLQAVGTLSARSNGLDNQRGAVIANGAVNVNAAASNAGTATLNSGGTIASRQASLVLSTGELRNTGASGAGTLTAAIDTTVSAVGALDNTGAQISAGRNLDVSATGNLANADGALQAVGTLTTRSNGLDNQRGAVVANGAVNVNAAVSNNSTATLNSGGIIASHQDGLTLATGELRNAGGSGAGKITAALDASVSAAGAVDNTAAQITAGRNLALASTGAIANSQGTVQAVGTASLRSNGLDNRFGTVASNEALVVNAAITNALTATDNTGGTIQSSQASLTLTTGALQNARANINDAGSVIAAATDITIAATGDFNNARSQIAAGQDLRITATGTLDNTSARLIGTRDASVAAGGIANTSGLIAGNRNTTLTIGAGGLANTQGSVQAGGDLALQSQGDVASNAGTIVAGGKLQLTSKALVNTDGTISAQTGDATLTATSYAGDGGTVVAGGKLSLTTQGGALSANNATFQSQGAMTLDAGNGAAQLSASTLISGNTLAITSRGLQAAQANVQAATDLTVSAGTGSLQAVGSTWVAGRTLSLTGGATNLQNATLFGNDSASVRGTSVDLTNANIKSPGDVNVVASSGALKIAGATLLAGNDLTATGKTIGSTAGATVHAGRDLTLGTGSSFTFGAADFDYQFGRDLTVHANGIKTGTEKVSARNLTLDAGSGLLDNTGNVLNATGDLSVSGKGIANAGGQIVALGNVTADAGSGTLNNAGGQIVSVESSTTVAGAAIQNANGVISGKLDVSITGGTLDNTGNQIAAGRSLSVNLTGALNNAGGHLYAIDGSASVTANGIDNTGGDIVSNTLGTTVNAGSGVLKNTGGVIYGTDVTIGGEVNNASGTISGDNSVTMTTRALNNDAGVIEAKSGGITIDTQGNQLTNINSGTLAGIVSTGAIRIKSGALNNNTGYIGADTALIIESGAIDNRGGTLLGLAGVDIDAGMATVDNRAGGIKSGADLKLTAGTLNNSGADSTVFAAGNLTITAPVIDNSQTNNGAFSNGILAGGNATITAETIANTNGTIVALGLNKIVATTSLNNTDGQIGGAAVDIDTPQFNNTTGRVDAESSLKLRAPQVIGGGTIASNGELVLNLQGDVNVAAKTNYSAKGTLTVTTTGAITNAGHVSAAGGDLNLTATGITNAETGTMDAYGAISLNVGGGTIDNKGLISANGGEAKLTAGTVTNTGRIYGDGVTINAGTISNTMNSAGTGAVIASRVGNVTLNGNLTNSNDAQVYSNQDISVSGTTSNTGAIINARGNITFGQRVANANAGITTALVTTTDTAAAGLYITPTWTTERFNAAMLGWSDYTGGHWVLPSTQYPFATLGADPKSPAKTCTTSESAGESCNYDLYKSGNPIWQALHVAEPSTAGLTAPGVPPNAQSCLIVDARDTSGDCGIYWTVYDAYDAAVKQRTDDAYANLQTAIDAYNTDLQGRTLIDWFETTITGSEVTKTTVTSSKPGQIIAGGNLTLNGGTSMDSIVIAGGTVSGNYTAPESTQGTKSTVETGSAAFNHREYSGGFCDCYSRTLSTPQPIASAPDIKSFSLPVDPVINSIAGAGSSTPVAGTPAVVPNVDTSAALARGLTNTPPSSGQTAGGNPTNTGAGGVNVSAQTTATPGSGNAPDNVNASAGASTVTHGNAGYVSLTGNRNVTMTAETTVTPGDITGVTGGSTTNPASNAQTDITVKLDTAPPAPLRGSYIATNVRAGQLTQINGLQAQFQELAAQVPLAPPMVAPSRAEVPTTVKTAGYKTVTSTNGINAPNNQLFRLSTQPGARYLVETDPAFTNYRNWASSSYMLTQLAMDPERTLKLYGDGFAEQRLVDDQIMSLTGRRFISGYSSTEDEYQALMDAGVMYARQYQLTPGVALSAEQMASLTTDIVWLEARTVTLPDGSTTQALVPVVYLRRPLTGDITPTGSLISGSNIELHITGGTNTGTLYANGDGAAGNGRLILTGDTLANSGTFAGHKIVLTADTIDNTGGLIQGVGAGSSAALNARDIIARTTTQTSAAEILGPNGLSTGTRTNVDRIATVNADSVVIAATNNVTLLGANITASTNLLITATGKITSDAVETGYTLNVPLGGSAQGRSGYVNTAVTTQQLTTLSGNNIGISATGDASFKGANVTAVNDLIVHAANLNIEAAKNSLAIDQQGVNSKGYERVATLDETLAGGVFSAGNSLSIKATNGDLTVTGAAITADTGLAELDATGNTNILNAYTQHNTLAQSYDSNKSLLSTHTKTADSSTNLLQVEASSVSGNTVSIHAGVDTTIQASKVDAVGALSLGAGNDLNVTTAQQLVDASNQRTDTTTPTGLAKFTASTLIAVTPVAAALITKTAGSQTGTQSSSTAIGSTITAGAIDLSVGRDATLTAATVIADGAITGSIGRNLVVQSGQNTQTSDGETTFKKSGYIGTVLQPAIGVMKENSATQSSSTTQVGSTLASLGGDINLTVAGKYTQTASDVIALDGTAHVKAQSIVINDAQDTQSGTQQSSFSKTAIGASVSVPLLDAARTIGGVLQASSDTSNARVQALAVATAALNAKSVIDSATQLAAGNLGGVKISVSLGHSESESQTQMDSSTSVGSNINAKNVILETTGAGANGNIALKGSDINATEKASFITDGELILQAGTNTYEQHSTNSSSGSNVGVGFAFGGGQNGFTLEAGANKGNANSNGSDLSYSNTHVTANQVSVVTGGDTTLKGAVVTANQVTGSIGGNLNIESLQDTSTYQSKQTNAGFGVSLCIPPLCYGMSSASVSGGKTNVDSTFTSVAEQSGIRTGDGGFNINVVGDTTLKGGAITTTDAGIAAGKDVFTHGGTITTTDIQNNAGYDANGFNLSLGLSGTAGGQTAIPTKLGGGAGFGSDSGSASSTTVSGISGVAGNMAVRTGDASTAITPIFDANRVTADINAQITITQAALPAVTKAWGDYANGQLAAATTDADKACWAEGGVCRVAGHVFIGALGGGAAGAAGAGVSQKVIPEIGSAIAGADLPDALKQTIVAGLGAVIGGAVGGAAGAVTGLDATVNNYLAHNPGNTRNSQLTAFARDLSTCQGTPGCNVDTVYARWSEISRTQQGDVQTALADGYSSGDFTKFGLVIAGAAGAYGANPADFCTSGDARCANFIMDQNRQASAVMMTAVALGAIEDVAGRPPATPVGQRVSPVLLDELAANNVKFTRANVVATGVNSSGQVIFMESGNSSAGLQHIVEQHGAQFASMGVAEAEIPDVVMRAVTSGKLVGYQGVGTGRPIYEITINGQPQRIAITVGSNGYIVGANPRGSTP